jgi:hypothetical protein
MAIYKVEIKEYYSKIVEVEADSEEQAESIIINQWHAEEIVLDEDDFFDCDIDIYKD